MTGAAHVAAFEGSPSNHLVEREGLTRHQHQAVNRLGSQSDVRAARASDPPHSKLGLERRHLLGDVHGVEVGERHLRRNGLGLDLERVDAVAHGPHQFDHGRFDVELFARNVSDAFVSS